MAALFSLTSVLFCVFDWRNVTESTRLIEKTLFLVVDGMNCAKFNSAVREIRVTCILCIY